MEIRLNDGGFYTLLVGCTDMGTGCDTILAQMAADCLDCGVDDIAVVELTHRDVVRHELVQAIVRAYEKHAAAKNRR